MAAVRTGCKNKIVLSQHYKIRGQILLFPVTNRPSAVEFNFKLSYFFCLVLL
jgi:hypothetical protein